MSVIRDTKSREKPRTAQYSSCPLTLCSPLCNLLQIQFREFQEYQVGFFFAKDCMSSTEKKVFEYVQNKLQAPILQIPKSLAADKPFGAFFAVLPMSQTERTAMEEEFCTKFQINGDEDKATPEDPDAIRWFPVKITQPSSKSKSNNSRRSTGRATGSSTRALPVSRVWAALEERLQTCVFRTQANLAQKNFEATVAPLLTFSSEAKDKGPPDQCILFWKMGAGKTLGAIRYARLTKAKKVLLIASKTLLTQWEKVLSKTLDALVPCTSWTLVSYERFCDLCSLYGKYEFPMDEFDLVIVDEAHYFKNLTGAKSFAVHILFQAKRHLYLTGTPMRNDESDLAFWVLALGGPDLRFQVGKESTLSDTCRAFSETQQFRNLFRGKIHCFDPVRMLPKQILHLNYPYVIRETVKTPLSLLQNVAYTFLTSGLRLHFPGSGSEEEEEEQGQMLHCLGPLKQWQRASPLSGIYLENTLSDENNDTQEDRSFVSSKSDRLLDLILSSPESTTMAEQNDSEVKTRSSSIKNGQSGRKKKSVVLYSRFKQNFPHIRERLLSRDSSLILGTICGETSVHERMEMIKNFNDGQVDVLMLCKVGGEGVDLAGATSLHVLEPQLNQAETEQAIGRVVRFHSTVASVAEAKTVRIYEHVSVLAQNASGFWKTSMTPSEEMKAVTDLLAVNAPSILEGIVLQSRNNKTKKSTLLVQDRQVLTALILQANREEKESVDEKVHRTNLEKAVRCQRVTDMFQELGLQTSLDDMKEEKKKETDLPADEDGRTRNSALQTVLFEKELSLLRQQVVQKRMECITNGSRIPSQDFLEFCSLIHDITDLLQECS